MLLRLLVLLALGTVLCVPGRVPAAAPPRFDSIRVLTNGAVSLRVGAETGTRYRLETSADLNAWPALATFAGAAAFDYVDSAVPRPGARFYRALALSDTNALTGDHLATSQGDVVLHPVNHASLLLQWNGLTIYVDPVGGSAPYRTFPRADLVLVTHSHGDHFDGATLQSVASSQAPIVAPAAVYSSLATALRARAIPLANGAGTNLLGLTVEAIPAYNGNHPKGAGNGYVLNLGGRRIYFTGDTGDIPEMRALREIDVAFVCMNTPFTMTVAQAAGAVRAFVPRVVYPYHFRNQDGSYSDLNAFARQVGSDLGIEVRARAWYP